MLGISLRARVDALSRRRAAGRTEHKTVRRTCSFRAWMAKVSCCRPANTAASSAPNSTARTGREHAKERAALGSRQAQHRRGCVRWTSWHPDLVSDCFLGSIFCGHSSSAAQQNFCGKTQYTQYIWTSETQYPIVLKNSIF